MSRRGLLLIAAVALLVRVLWAVEIFGDDGPAGLTMQVLLGDERAYDGMARGFAGGGPTRDRAFYQEPLYAWLVSLVYRAAPPTPLSDPRATVIAPETAHAVVLVVQHLLGALTALLVALLGARVGGRRTGLLAGLLAATCGPAVFHESMLLKSALGLLVTTVALLAWLSLLESADPDRADDPPAPGPAPRRPLRGRALVLGAVLGVGILLRGNLYLLLGLVLLSLLPAWRRRPRESLLACAWMLGVVAVLLLPVTLHNLSKGDVVLTTYQSGSNAALGMPDHDDVRLGITYAPLRAGRGDAMYEEEDAVSLAEAGAGRALSSREVSAWWWDEWRRRVAARPGVFAGRFGLKALSTFHGDEIPDVKDWQFVRGSVPWLASPLTDFSIVGPLALVGALLLPWRRRRGLAVVRGALLMVMVSLALFYVMGRYRLSAAPALWILAAATLDQALAAWRRGGGARLVWTGLVLGCAVLGTWVWTGGLALRPDVRGHAGFQVSWSNYATVEAHLAGRAETAEEARRHRDLGVLAARRSVEQAPLFPAGRSTLVRLLDLSMPGLPPRADEAWAEAWRLLFVLEGDRTGIDVTERVEGSLAAVQDGTLQLLTRPSRPGADARTAPGRAFACRRLVQDLKAPADQALALSLIDLALALEPDDAVTHVQRGQVLRRLDRLPEAIAAYRRGAALGADSGELHNNLGNALLELGDAPGAVIHFELALERLPGHATILANLARARDAAR